MILAKILDLIKKSFNSLKNEGLLMFGKRIRLFISARIHKYQFKEYHDILFINGCSLPHPTRYRVYHQQEQLEAFGLSSNVVNVESLTLDMMKYYRGFIFFRCPITPLVTEFIKLAKTKNKTVFFDIDDLVIDKKYTKTIQYLETMSKDDLDLYYDGISRMQETLKMCDYAIAPTEVLKKELENYVKEAYVNRNVASEEMVALSLQAVAKTTRNKDKIVMGYLSGSITHNADFAMIMPVIKRLLAEYPQLYLQVIGLLEVPQELTIYKERILTVPFTDWHNIPELIASIDINLAPLDQTLFNEAKSEIKWIEAALCKTPTIASQIGAFASSIENGITGILCPNNDDDWYINLKHLIDNKDHREHLGINAFNKVIKEHTTTYTGQGILEFIQSKLSKNIAFVIPTTNISGGLQVAINHAIILRKHGYDVTFINLDQNDRTIKNSNGNFDVICYPKTKFYGYFDTMVATLWSTLKIIQNYPNVLNRSYLVQNFETDFMKYGDKLKRTANATYCSLIPIRYLTISKWCQEWLKNRYGKTSTYCPNGLNVDLFPYRKRSFHGKIKVLIEGNCDAYYKNVDESFKIADKLDKNKYEIYYLSAEGVPKKWYYIDHFFHKVPYEEVGKIYKECDILLKSSLLESFSYPPLEMMTTGGVCVVVANEGNKEYLVDRENCLFYRQGDIDDAISKIEEVINNKSLREKIIKNGRSVAMNREWYKIEKKVLNLYR